MNALLKCKCMRLRKRIALSMLGLKILNQEKISYPSLPSRKDPLSQGSLDGEGSSFQGKCGEGLKCAIRACPLATARLKPNLPIYLHYPGVVTEAGLGIPRLSIAKKNGSGRGTARVQGSPHLIIPPTAGWSCRPSSRLSAGRGNWLSLELDCAGLRQSSLLRKADNKHLSLHHDEFGTSRYRDFV